VENTFIYEGFANHKYGMGHFYRAFFTSSSRSAPAMRTNVVIGEEIADFLIVDC
jgi:hypothetical protein